MDKIPDDWMRPRTRAGMNEMRKRLKAMRELLNSSSSQNIEAQFAAKMFKEYFSFRWESDRPWELEEE